MENIRAVIAQITGHLPDEINVSIRPPLKFQSNNLYDVWIDGQQLIAKEYLRENERMGASEREYKALKLLETFNIAPKPVCFDQSHENPIVIYEYMEGKMWDRQTPSARDLTKLLNIWETINTISSDEIWFSKGTNRRVHQIAQEIYQRLRSYAAWASSNFEGGEIAAKICLNLIERRFYLLEDFMGIKPNYVFCKSDPRFANVVQRPNSSLGLVDWEDCGMRDPARELADLITHPNQEDLLTWDDWGEFVDGYAEFLSEKDPQMIDRLHFYMAIFPIFWLSIISDRGITLSKNGDIESWQVNDLSANARLRRYLARAAAWPEYDFSQQMDEFSIIKFFPENRKA